MVFPFVIHPLKPVMLPPLNSSKCGLCIVIVKISLLLAGTQTLLAAPCFVLSKKLKLLKTKLKVWNKEVYGNVHQHVNNAEVTLNHIQNQIQTTGPTDNLLNLEQTAQIDLNIALERQESFWREKSKVKWHLEGDRNTGYFQTFTNKK